MQRRLLFPAISMLAVCAISFAFAACSNQAEGDRCDKNDDNGGNDDCQSGLVCFSKTVLPGAQTDICCPPDRTQSTTVICAIHPTPPNADAAVPLEGGSGDDAGIDAASEAGDGAVEANAPDSGTPDAGIADASEAG